VASRRCRRRGARLSGAVASGQASRLAIDAEAHWQVSHGAFDVRHRRTAFIRSRQSRAAGDDSPREGLATEQPSRELACSSAATRAKDATLPIGWIGSAVPVSTCFGLQHLQHLPPSRHLCNEASVPDRSLRSVARRCRRRGLSENHCRIVATDPNNVTKPPQDRTARLPHRA